MKKIMAVALGAVLLYGCVAPSVVSPKKADLPAFPQSEYASIKVDGSETLSGQAFLTTMGGDVKVAAGQDIMLMPKTSYTDAIYNYQTTGVAYNTPDSRYAKYTKMVQADAQGKFTFTDIAPGKYYVETMIMWYRPSQFGLMPEGGLVITPTEVVKGKNNTVMVTR